jgi:hypothetical protein
MDEIPAPLVVVLMACCFCAITLLCLQPHNENFVVGTLSPDFFLAFFVAALCPLY